MQWHNFMDTWLHGYEFSASAVPEWQMLTSECWGRALPCNGLVMTVKFNDYAYIYKVNNCTYFANLKRCFSSQHCILGSLLIVKPRMLCLDSRKTCPYSFFKYIAKDLIPEETKPNLKEYVVNW